MRPKLNSTFPHPRRCCRMDVPHLTEGLLHDVVPLVLMQLAVSKYYTHIGCAIVVVSPHDAWSITMNRIVLAPSAIPGVPTKVRTSFRSRVCILRRRHCGHDSPSHQTPCCNGKLLAPPKCARKVPTDKPRAYGHNQSSCSSIRPMDLVLQCIATSESLPIMDTVMHPFAFHCLCFAKRGLGASKEH